MRYELKLGVLSAAVALALGLSACGGSGGEKKADGKAVGGAVAAMPANKTTLVVNNGTEPETLDPAKSSGVPEDNIERQLLEGLVVVGKDGKIAPGVATSWENKDFKVWTFKLRDNAKWSNGDPVTAEDFVYSWQRVTDPKTASPYGSYLADAHVVNAQAVLDGKAKPATLGVKAVDAHTFEVTLSEPVPYFVDMLTHSSVLPVHKATVEKGGEKWTQAGNFIGNGAYVLKEWTVNSKIALERNKNYWNDAATQINQVEMLTISEETTDVNRFKAGEIDVTYNALLTDMFAQLKTELGEQVHVTPYLCTYYYEFNTKKAPFNDPKVRRALSLALDRDVIAEKVMQQGQTPAYSFTPVATNNYKANHPEWEKWNKEQRIAEAKKLLNEAGYSDAKPLDVTLLYNTSENHKKVAVAASALWKQALGFVNINLDNKEWKTYLDSRRTGNYQFARAGWCADYNEPSSFLNTLKTGNGNNYGKYSNANFDALMVKTLATGTTDEQRADLYQQIEAQADVDMPVIPIYHYVSPRLVKSYVQGMSKDPLDKFYFKDMSFKK